MLLTALGLTQGEYWGASMEQGPGWRKGYLGSALVGLNLRSWGGGGLRSLAGGWETGSVGLSSRLPQVLLIQTRRLLLCQTPGWDLYLGVRRSGDVGREGPGEPSELGLGAGLGLELGGEVLGSGKGQKPGSPGGSCPWQG